ncbi:CHC2 zinc finger domain-containing protein [Alicyclobacillus ferrooxydans]|uniref:CHC2 zinc finger domain-containing protein n=1 Tax=Alicyclobacillus ferrooxydans TaxID=471514 RepID=UPI0009FA3318|nr:CHC2 zinc finger domain-containing protein [Alicyclobacillus ferrooxydans]
MIGIEEVALRNRFRLYPTARFGQFKAHCPECQDKRRQFHLYVSAVKDTFYCHKCGAKGGVVAFHAWLTGIPFQMARNELYPASKRKFPRHPAEQLTREQLAEMGFTTRMPSPIAPKAFTQSEWSRYRRRTLDWIWREWCEYEKFRKEQDARLYRMICQGMASESAHPESLQEPVLREVPLPNGSAIHEDARADIA